MTTSLRCSNLVIRRERLECHGVRLTDAATRQAFERKLMALQTELKEQPAARTLASPSACPALSVPHTPPTTITRIPRDDI